MAGSGRVGKELTCDRGEWDEHARDEFKVAWYRSNVDRARPPARPRAERRTTRRLQRSGRARIRQPGAAATCGPLKVGGGRKYRPTAEDVGKLVYCQVSATNDGATVWETASAPPIVAS